MTESLSDLVASWRARIGAALSDADQQALLAVKRFAYNAAAECWPGWSISDEAADPRQDLESVCAVRRSRLISDAAH